MSLAEEIVGDMLETEFDFLSDAVRKVDPEREPGVHWGEMTKYNDEDFRGVRRLDIPERVDFVQRSTHIEGNPVGIFVIRNTSSLPMTYMIVAFDQDYHTKRITPTPDMGWIAPHSVALLEIRLTEKDSKLTAAPSFGTRLGKRALRFIHVGQPYLGYFYIYGAPIFREEHVQETKLELFWKGFGTALFPRKHAELHVSKLAVSTVKLVGDGEYKIHRLICGSDPAPKKWTKNLEQASAEEFNSLWTIGNDPYEHKFCLEFRVKEYQHVAKRPDSPQEKRSLCETIFCFPLWLIFGFLLLLNIFCDLSNHSCCKGPESNSLETE